jgi:hypothetical protein
MLFICNDAVDMFMTLELGFVMMLCCRVACWSAITFRVAGKNNSLESFAESW